MSARIEHAFPALRSSGYQITSPATKDYNCIAWAAEKDTTWWWPDAYGVGYWPSQVSRTETIEAFIAAYGLLGYEPCTDAQPEPGFEKLAIYVDPAGVPTHAARLLPSGRWTSKLGAWEDGEHNALDGLNGNLYGRVGLVLRRSVSVTAPGAK